MIRTRKARKLVTRKPYILFDPEYAAIIVDHKGESVCVVIGSPDTVDRWIEDTKEIWEKAKGEMKQLEDESAIKEGMRIVSLKREKTS